MTPFKRMVTCGAAPRTSSGTYSERASMARPRIGESMATLRFDIHRQARIPELSSLYQPSRKSMSGTIGLTDTSK